MPSSKKKRKRKVRHGRLAIVFVGLALVIAAIGGGIYGLSHIFLGSREKEIVREVDVNGAQIPITKEPTQDDSFTFVGVGDNLLHDRLFRTFMDKYGNRNFLKQYENLVPYTEKSDLNYINLETLIAGDAYGFSGYPCFNGPSEYFDSLEQAGFNWISAASNHTLDYGDQAVIDEKNYANEHVPNVSVTGIHTSQEDADTPVVRDVNGLKVGLATFTFGENMNVFPDNSWLIDIYRNPDYSINYDLLDQRLDALNAISDVQIISVHWGNEYETVPNEEERELAEYFNSKGVEAVIGTHPHVIQPVEMIHGDNQDTLVYYSLGNALSGQDTNDRMIGGMASFKLDYDRETGTSTFSDIAFIPTISLINSAKDEFSVVTIDQYTDEMAQDNYITDLGYDMSKQWIIDYVKSVMGESTEEITIDTGEPAADQQNQSDKKSA